MYKRTLLTLCCFLAFTFVEAQQVFYSEKESNLYDMMGHYIIGKIKNNIVVVKYLNPGKRFELLIYDYNMHLRKTKPLNFFLPGTLYRIDFINRGNFFDAIVQYYTSKNYYCKIARFDEKGDLVQPIKTIDSVAVKNFNGNEAYDVIESEDKQTVSLLHALTGVKPSCLQLDYLLIDNSLHIIKRKQQLIPFNSSIQISPFYLDNGGNLLFAEFLSTDNNSNSFITYKILKDNDTAVNSVQFVGSYVPVDFSLQIDNLHQQYFVNGILEKKIDNDSSVKSNYVQNLYSCLFDKDLGLKGSDTLFQLKQMTGFETITINGALFFNNIISAKDSGYYIACASTVLPDVSVRYVAEAPPSILTTNEQPFYIKPEYTDAMRQNTNTLNQSTNPIYYNQGQSGSNYTTSYTQNNNSNYRKIEGTTVSKLFLLHINNQNQLQWSLMLDGKDENNNNPMIDLCKGINAKELHFVYGRLTGKNKKTIGEIIITPDGGYKIKPLIANNLHYDIKLQAGVQIDEKSIVFPCSANKRLAFAKIEFD